MNHLAFAEVSVTVQQNDFFPHPQIYVNGEMVRPRMFWGMHRGGNVGINDEWQEISFDVSVPFDANATHHFRFGKYPGEVWLKDFKIKNAETDRIVFPNNTLINENTFKNSWNVYPPDERNTVGNIGFVDSCFHVTISEPQSGKSWPDFHIYSDYVNIPEGVKYNFSCKVKSSSDRIIFPAVYHVKNGWTYIGGPESYFEEQIEMAKNVGVDFITFNTPNCWFSPEKGVDWLPMDVACQNVLNVNPDALLIPRISMDAPNWWLEENPDAYMVFEDGSKGTKASISHRKYREEAAIHLGKICRHLREKFPENLAGIHPSGQNTGEWFYEQSWESKLSGYDPATLDAWQNYPTGTGNVPSANSRRPSSERLLLDPEKDEEVIHFNQFLQDEMADFLIELSDAARRGLGDEKLVMFFYGYHYELAAPWNGPATTGHFALRKILEAPNIDILAGPISYYDRGLGGSGANMSSVESVIRSGKMWVDEDDTRTYLNKNLDDHNRYGGLSNREETQNVLLRNLGQSAIRGYGSWWMDHGAGTGGGWFADAELWKVLDQSKKIDSDLRWREGFYQPEIAMILNENSMLHIAGGSTILGRQLVYGSRAEIAKSGTSFGQYTVDDDIGFGIESDLKIYLAAWVLSDEEREKIIHRRRKGQTRVWFYAPGYIREDQNDLDAMKELTGFDYQKIDINSALASPTEAGCEIGLESSWGFDTKITPLFTVNPDSCVVLAKYENGQAAVAMKESVDGNDIFIGIPKLTEELVKTLVKVAGIRKSTEDEVLLWNSSNYTVLHGLKDGEINLDFGENTASIDDIVTGKYSTNDHKITLDLKRGETLILKHDEYCLGYDEENNPVNFQLHQNYPNPFNSTTKIEYSVSLKSIVKIEVFNILGEKVDTVINQEHLAGKYYITWNASEFCSGIYILKMTSNNFNSTRKMLLVK